MDKHRKGETETEMEREEQKTMGKESDRKINRNRAIERDEKRERDDKRKIKRSPNILNSNCFWTCCRTRCWM